MAEANAQGSGQEKKTGCQEVKACLRKNNSKKAYQLVNDLTRENNFLSHYTQNNNKMICAPGEDSDQAGHLTSLIKVFAVRMK